MKPVSSRVRTRTGGSAAGVVLLYALILFAAAIPHEILASGPDNAPGASIIDQRRAVEKASRSRYRDLEVASLIVILVAGGAAIWWTFRRK